MRSGKEMNKVRLYHGSNVPVYVPEIRVTYPHDFGNAFYVTSDFRQAKKWALHKAKYSGKAYVSCYTMDKEVLRYIRTLYFNQPSKKWLDLVVKCRQNKYQPNGDLIIGPVMDGRKSWISLRLYSQHKLTYEETLDRLNTHVLSDQWAFTGIRALSFLNFCEVIEV